VLPQSRPPTGKPIATSITTRFRRRWLEYSAASALMDGTMAPTPTPVSNRPSDNTICPGATAVTPMPTVIAQGSRESLVGVQSGRRAALRRASRMPCRKGPPK